MLNKHPIAKQVIEFGLQLLTIAAFVFVTTFILQCVSEQRAHARPGVIPALVLDHGTKVYTFPLGHPSGLGGCVITESKVMGGAAASVSCR
jgi:formate-dependent nitrite reductase membrane component NrfD